jgi:hypothetical protein
MRYGKQLVDAIHDKKLAPDMPTRTKFSTQGIEFSFSVHFLGMYLGTSPRIITHIYLVFVEEHNDTVQHEYKKASLEWNAIQALNSVKCQLRTPLMCILDFKGFRVEAVATFHNDEVKEKVNQLKKAFINQKVHS